MKTRLSPVLVLGLFLALSLTVPCSAALTIIGGSSATNDRFTTSGTFFASGLDFSSVGRVEANTAPFTAGDRMMTVISPHFALVAEHYSPAVGQNVAFSLGNSATTLSDTVQQVYQVSSTGGAGGSGTELALVQFTNALPSSYIASIASDSPSLLANHQIYVYGQGNVVNGARSDYVGLNNITPVIQYDDNGSGVAMASFSTTIVDSTTQRDGQVFFFDFNNPQNSFYNSSAPGPYESYLEAGDSSAPSFVDINGQLALVGVHWFQYPGYNSLNGSADIYVPAYISAINARIHSLGFTNENVSVLAVPEPASLFLLGLGGLGLALGRARRSRRLESVS